jgi:hypothetical protein
VGLLLNTSGGRQATCMAGAISVLWALVVPCLLSSALRAGSEVEFVTEELPWAVVGKEYSPAPLEVRIAGRCPAGGVGFAVVSGTLPPGLKLSRLGYFSGTPKQIGQFEFSVKAVNGCSWTGKFFALLVTDAPRLAATPVTLSATCPQGVNPPPMAIQVVGSWPDLAYQVSISGAGWMTATPERGRTSREAAPRRIGAVHSDDIAVRFNTSGLKPGRYTALVVVSAWQAEPVMVPVELTVTERRSPPDQAPSRIWHGKQRC